MKDLVDQMLLVGCGGALGATLRFMASQYFGARSGTTFAVNISGAFLLGFLMGSRLSSDLRWRVFLGVGVLGGYTTFSTLAFEAMRLHRTTGWQSAWTLLAASAGGGTAGSFRRFLAGKSGGRMMAIRRLHLNVNHFGLGAGIASIAMFFAALALAFGLSIKSTPSWQRFEVPLVLWISTGVLVLSSASLEGSKYALRRARVTEYRQGIALTVLLASLFLLLQIASAWELIAQHVDTVRNPYGSAFYCFIALHGLHLAIGFVWLGLLYSRSRSLIGAGENDLRKHRGVVGVASLYWHFMGVLWLLLFALLVWWSQ